MKWVKVFYFFVKLSVKGEPVTHATRFKYFLVSASGKENSYEAEMTANKKIYKIAALLSQQDNTTYKVAHVEEVSTEASNVLEEHFPLYDHQGDKLILINKPWDRVLANNDNKDDDEEGKIEF